MAAILEIQGLKKSYADGFEALKGVDLQIEAGEIIPLLGPNGAGKTTLISTICGNTQATSGKERICGYDKLDNYREARAVDGLVPQEIHLEPFERVINTVRFSRGLFGKSRDDKKVEEILRQLSLWDKRDNQIRELSGGMKRRVLIAKALSHEPQLLFLDEPTAGVDVELRKDMWAVVETLKAKGVTIVLTTHYIEEAEAIADRVGVIAKGELLIVEDKDTLMERMGKKQLDVQLKAPLTEIPDSLVSYGLVLSPDGQTLTYSYDTRARTGITQLLSDVSSAGMILRDVETRQSSLEDIFVDLVSNDGEPAP